MVSTEAEAPQPLPEVNVAPQLAPPGNIAPAKQPLQEGTGCGMTALGT